MHSLRCLAVHFEIACLFIAPQFPGAVAAETANLALVANPSTSYVSGHERLEAINDGFTPRSSEDKSHGTHGNWPRKGTQWIQYDWSQPVFINAVQVYWFVDGGGLKLPVAARLKYWDGSGFVAVPGAAVEVKRDRFNEATFPELSTSKLRLEFDSDGDFSTAVVEWRVLDSGRTPNFPPIVRAGVDRTVVGNGRTYLEGFLQDDHKPAGSPVVRWSQVSGPGAVSFEAPEQRVTSARFSAPGEYVLRFAGNDGQAEASDDLRVRVEPAPPAGHLRPVWTTRYRVSSPFWRPRLKNLVVNWIPHCIQKCEDPESKEGGIGNFVEARRKLAGATDARHTGAVFANTWVYNTLESMCIAQMLEAEGDPELLAAQAAMRKTIEDWVVKMLGAQEPDGYLHTQYTIEGHKRWSDKHAHEDYQAGYFMEAAIAHHLMTEGKDPRMLQAALRLADCWVRHIGPAPKRTWYPGHQELEMALFKLARYIQATEPAKAAAYKELARFLLDARGGGDEYDQSHAPVTRQYEAVGHAVRAVYSYVGMADVALETRDPDYLSAVQSIWDNLVNRKYYLTGGIGSGETSEGFGRDYSLPNHSYCESCANCGQMFFQQRLQLLYREGRYADLAEETLFNGILGSVDLDAQNYTYTNPLDSGSARYKWHVCPCCVGNIPRTLLSLPDWTYSTGTNAVYVNQFVGGTVTLNDVAGGPIQVVQTTVYPWSGKVALVVNPAQPARFALHLRVPNRQSSLLYTNTPRVDGLRGVTLNGEQVSYRLERGYAVIERTWKAGDEVRWEIPLEVQRVRSDDRVVANRGRVALRYGPLIYNAESVDQDLNASLPAAAPLTVGWRADLLGGVMAIEGRYAEGKPLLAIPNFARLNRGGRSLVWLKEAEPNSAQSPGRIREAWDWADRMREVARRGLNSNRAGVVLTLGDSLSYANSSTRWARTATGASPGQMAVLKWSHAGEQNDRDGWWLAAVDRPENRSETAASGLRTDECLRGGRGGLAPLSDLVSRYRPQVVFVLLGANDASARRAPEMVAADMGAILDVLLDHGTVPVLQLLAPRADPAADDLSREYNRRFVELARARQIPLIDLRGEFLERAPQGAWRTQLLQPDGLHFSHERADGPPSAENLANCGYLLRCWLAVEKLAEIKGCVFDLLSES